MDDLTKELARSCAKGKRQLAFINEMLNGKSFYTQAPIPGQPWAGNVRHFGFAQLDSTSYRNLEKRLTGVGFRVIIGPEDKRGTADVELEFT